MILTTLSGDHLEGTPEEMTDFFLKIKKQQASSTVESVVEPKSREATYYYSESRNALLCVQDMHTKHIFHAILHRINWNFGSNNALGTVTDTLYISNLIKELYYRTIK